MVDKKKKLLIHSKKGKRDEAMPAKRQVKSDAFRFATLLAKVAGAGILRIAVLSWLIQTGTTASVLAAPEDPLEILHHARLNQASQYRVLEGRVRHGETVIPFRLALEGGEIRYEFSNPDQTLVLQLGEKGSRLVEITKKGGEREVTDAQYDRPVRGTEITYEDLSMRFLYWPVAKILGEEVLVTQNCWILRVEPASGKDSQYGAAKLWIQKRSGALVRVETYDHRGNFVKRFEVISVQKVEGGYVLKQMRIQRMLNGKPGDSTPTYLEIQSPDKAPKE